MQPGSSWSGLANLGNLRLRGGLLELEHVGGGLGGQAQLDQLVLYESMQGR